MERRVKGDKGMLRRALLVQARVNTLHVVVICGEGVKISYASDMEGGGRLMDVTEQFLLDNGALPRPQGTREQREAQIRENRELISDKGWKANAAIKIIESRNTLPVLAVSVMGYDLMQRNLSIRTDTLVPSHIFLNMRNASICTNYQVLNTTLVSYLRA